MCDLGAYAIRKSRSHRRCVLVSVRRTSAHRKNQEPAWAQKAARTVPAQTLVPGGNAVGEARYSTQDQTLASALRELGCTQRIDGTFRESYAADLAVMLQLTPNQRMAVRLHDWARPQAPAPPQHTAPRSEFLVSDMDQFGLDKDGEVVKPGKCSRKQAALAAVEEVAGIPDPLEQEEICANQPPAVDKREYSEEDDAPNDPTDENQLSESDETKKVEEDDVLDDPLDTERYCPHCGYLISLCHCRSEAVDDAYLEQDEQPLRLTAEDRQRIAQDMSEDVAKGGKTYEGLQVTLPSDTRHTPRTWPMPLDSYCLPYDRQFAYDWDCTDAPLTFARRGRPCARPRTTPYPGCAWPYERTDSSWQAMAFWYRFPWGIPLELISGDRGWWAWVEQMQPIIEELEAECRREQGAYDIPREVMERAQHQRRRREMEPLLDEIVKEQPDLSLSERDVRLGVALALPPSTWIPPEELLPAETGIWLPTRQVARILGIKPNSVSRWHQRNHIQIDKNGVREHHFRLEDVVQRVNELASATDRFFPWHQPTPEGTMSEED